MGDNRNQSRDSRWFGFVDRESIVGEATAVVISFDREKSFSHASATSPHVHVLLTASLLA